MVKERINEIVDFATTQSPYDATSKGWINNFVFFELGQSDRDPSANKEELVNISVNWNTFLATIIFGLAFIPAILTFAFLTFL